MAPAHLRLLQHIKGQRAMYTWLSFTCLVSLALLGYRMLHSSSTTYSFLAWNLFLAAIPFGISRWLMLKQRITGWHLLLAIPVWLLFFPTAPYCNRLVPPAAAHGHAAVVRPHSHFFVCLEWTHVRLPLVNGYGELCTPAAGQMGSTCL